MIFLGCFKAYFTLFFKEHKESCYPCCLVVRVPSIVSSNRKKRVYLRMCLFKLLPLKATTTVKQSLQHQSLQVEKTLIFSPLNE